MKNSETGRIVQKILQNVMALILTLSCALFAGQAELHAFQLNVEGCNANNVCTPLPGGFRYLVEVDNTTLTIPQTVQINPPSATLAIHKSHAPVVSSGSSAGPSTTVAVPAGQPDNHD